jgi:hypothetical protein
MTKIQKETEIKPWDRRPWPLRGDADDRTVYQHVGHFLSFWERYEAALAFLFSSFFGPLPVSDPARRSYFAVRTFEGWAEMLRAASSKFLDARKSPELQKRGDEAIKYAVLFSQRRNDIAHGSVDQFQTQDQWQKYGWMLEGEGFALYPSLASFKGRDVRAKPSYCMTSNELTYFYREVVKLQPKTVALADDIIKHGRSTPLGMPPPPSPT